jgi:Cofactor assembly of complex C subunit B, CCB2/CCB4
MSCVLVAPLGVQGVLIAGGDRQRGFTQLDQAWVSNIADKLEDTFEVSAPAGIGFQGRKSG